mgnify:CR=1 FL=1
MANKQVIFYDLKGKQKLGFLQQNPINHTVHSMDGSIKVNSSKTKSLSNLINTKNKTMRHSKNELVCIAVSTDSNDKCVRSEYRTSYTYNQQQKVVEIFPRQSIRNELNEFMGGDKFMWVGKSKDYDQSFEHHVLFLVSESIRVKHPNEFSELPLMDHDETESIFFKTDIKTSKSSRVRLQTPVFEYLMGNYAYFETTPSKTNRNFYNHIRTLLSSNATPNRATPSFPREKGQLQPKVVAHLDTNSNSKSNTQSSKRPRSNNAPIGKLLWPKSRIIFRGHLNHNGTRHKYVFYPDVLKDPSKVITYAASIGAHPHSYTMVGGYPLVRLMNKKNKKKNISLILLPVTSNQQNVTLPANTVPLMVSTVV